MKEQLKVNLTCFQAQPTSHNQCAIYRNCAAEDRCSCNYLRLVRLVELKKSPKGMWNDSIQDNCPRQVAEGVPQI